MRKIAPEIDELMWTLAEQRDPQALDEFGQRFPDLRQELGKRLAMTAGLKSASTVSRPQSIPRFTPTPAPPVWWSRPAAVMAAAAVLVVMAFGSFKLMQSWAKPEDTVVIVPVTPPKTTPTVQPNENPNSRQNPNEQLGNDQPKQPDKTVAQQVPPYMEPRSLDVKGTRLPQVLAMIEQACGLEISVPDLPADLADMDVDAQFTNINGMQMLAELGSKYGFTAFTQGGNKVLIIPARDTNADTSGGQ